MVSWFIARRYLISRFITVAAFLLISLSVAILIILLAVMEGFKTEMIERIRGTSSDVKVKSTQFIGMDDYPAVRKLVESVPGVEASVPYIDTLVMFKLLLPRGYEERTGHFNLLVLDLQEEALAGELDDYIRNYAIKRGSRGSMVRPGLPLNIKNMISRHWIEVGLWEYLGVPPPKKVEELKPIILGSETFPYYMGPPIGFQMDLTSISPVTNQPRTSRFVIVGHFRSQDVQQDTQTLLMDLADAIDFLALKNPENDRTSISGLRLFLDEGEDVAAVKERIEASLASAEVPFVTTETWEEEKAKILNAVKMEKTLVGIILGVIIIFVALMIFIVMTVLIVEKTKDLGIIQAVGMRPAGILFIYMRVGAVICLAGILLGLIYGVGFCLSMETIQRWLFLLTGKEIFPRTVYYIDTIPVRLVVSDFLFIIVPTVLFSFLASLMAALRAARMHPLDALRWE